MNDTNKMSCLAFIITVSLIVLGTAFSGVVTESRGNYLVRSCNLENYAGSYAYSEFGLLPPDNPLGLPAGKYNAAGVVRLDAAGEYALSSVSSINGTVQNHEISGTWALGDDCEIRLWYGGIQLSVNYLSEDRISLYGVVTMPKTNISVLGSGR